MSDDNKGALLVILFILAILWMVLIIVTPLKLGYMLAATLILALLIAIS